MEQQFLSQEALQHLNDRLNAAQHIVATCHVSPDGDAIGSMLALVHALRRRGKEVTPIVPNIFPDFLHWMPGAEGILTYDKQAAEADVLIAAADLFICVDFNELSRLEGMAPAVTANPAPKLMFDHHLHPQQGVFDLMVSQPEMCSSCEVVFRVLWQQEGLEALTTDEAVCLYTGMMTDTGGFRYNSGRSEIFEIIGMLLTKGIDKDKIYRNVFYSYSADRFRLMGYLLYVKLKTFREYNAALMTLTRQERRRFTTKNGDTEGFVNLPLEISGTKLSIFLREDTERKNVIRVSLRSVDDFPCNRMAADFFNGGGHLNASGGELKGTMEQAEQVVHEALKAYAPMLKG